MSNFYLIEIDNTPFYLFRLSSIVKVSYIPVLIRVEGENFDEKWGFKLSNIHEMDGKRCNIKNIIPIFSELNWRMKKVTCTLDEAKEVIGFLRRVYNHPKDTNTNTNTSLKIIAEA